MRYLYCMLIAVFILWRTFQIAVVVPATLAGSALLIYTLTGHSPVAELVSYIHDRVRTAAILVPPGMMLMEECAQSAAIGDTTADTELPEPVFCESQVAKFMPVDWVARSAGHLVRGIYVFFLMLAFCGVYIAYPGRRYVGLVERPAQTDGDGCAACARAAAGADKGETDVAT